MRVGPRGGQLQVSDAAELLDPEQSVKWPCCRRLGYESYAAAVEASLGNEASYANSRQDKGDLRRCGQTNGQPKPPTLHKDTAASLMTVSAQTDDSRALPTSAAPNGVPWTPFRRRGRIWPQQCRGAVCGPEAATLGSWTIANAAEQQQDRCRCRKRECPRRQPGVSSESRAAAAAACKQLPPGWRAAAATEATTAAAPNCSGQKLTDNRQRVCRGRQKGAGRTPANQRIGVTSSRRAFFWRG